MNKKISYLVASALFAVGVATTASAGTWAFGYYYDGPICTACLGSRVINTSAGSVVCPHCEGTGLEPPSVAEVVSTVIVDAIVPPPIIHHHPVIHHPPVIRPHHLGPRPPAPRPAVHRAPPPPRPAVHRAPAPRPAVRRAPSPAPRRPAGGVPRGRPASGRRR